MSRIEEALKRSNSTTASARAVRDDGRNDEQLDDVAATQAWNAAQDEADSLFAPPRKPAQVVHQHPSSVAANPAAMTSISQQTVPQSAETSTRPLGVFQGFPAEISERLVVSPKVNPSSLEQYRRLAATLHHAQCERGIKVVMVTSAAVGEGKSLSTANLALTFSESYRRRVLVVDADLRRPSIHEIFGIPNLSGLSDSLKADADKPLSTIQISQRLTILTAGRPDQDPMGVLASERMQRLITEAAQSFDWVFIDTPPVAVLTDANLLARLVDTVLLVVRATSTPYELIQRAVEAVGRERIIGVLLNAVEQKSVATGYGYYGYGNAPKS